MPVRRLPVCPKVTTLGQEAEGLLRAIRAGDPHALEDLHEFHPERPDPTHATLADARLVLARSYQASSWDRLVQAAQLTDAIWRDDIDAVRGLVTRHPHLLHEDALIRRDSNWGPPMTYAANVGRDRIIRMIHELGATDLPTAMARASLQGKIATARMIHVMLGEPAPPDDALGGPAYTLSVSGTRLVFAIGGRAVDELGRRLAPVDVVLQTDGRNPSAKHAILEMYAEHGVELPDTPVMALHRERIDLLDAHLDRDPTLLSRTFTHRDIYPAAMGCLDALDATVGTPLGGTTLLHMCVDYDEFEIARWLLDRGMDPNARSEIGDRGFGGYTALFNTVVSQPNFWMNYRNRGPLAAPMTELLLARGADPNIRASIWKRLHPGHGDPARHEYRDVTALSWGRRFHAPVFVSQPAMRLIGAAGGTD